MADNTSTKVLTIDTGNAISNVKDFKARIEELKGALLGLENGTEEYNAVAKELRNTQQKLTEVMDVAKGRAEGVEGSYDNLVAKMRQLKQEWRATADEATRTNLGSQILDINNQLKELDASTGNFQRNVGDYANAFENAFRAMIGGIGRFNPELSKTAATVGSLIPVIKQTATVATASLQGIKKAIASTGIGLLVIAVGLLASNWDKVSKAIMKSTKAGKEMYEAEERIDLVAKSIETTTENQSKAMDFQERLMRAQGQSEESILEYKAGQLQAQLKLVKAKREELGVIFSQQQAALEQAIAEDRAEWRINRLEKARDKALEAMNEGNKAVKAIADDLAIVEATLNRIRSNKNPIIPLGGDSKSSKSDAKASAEKAKSEWEEILNDLNKRIGNEGLKDFEIKLKELKEEYEDALKKGLEAGANAEDLKKLQEVYFKDRFKVIADYYVGENEKAQEAAKKMDAYLIAQIKADLENRKTDIDKLQKTMELSAKEFESSYNLPWQDMEKFFGKDDVWTSGMKNIEGRMVSMFDVQKTLIDETYENRKASIEAEIEALRQIYSLLDSETIEADNTFAQIIDKKNELESISLQHTIDTNNLINQSEEELHQKRMDRMDSLSNMFSSIGNLMNNIGALMEEQINAEVEDGKISEETAKKRFENVKKMQIGAAVINMAAGVVSAIAQAQQLGPILGPIMAAINSAAVIAAGAVQISQIKRTKYGSDTSGNISTPNLQRATVPIVPEPTQNITGQSELTQLSNAINSKPVIVKVTDIEDTQAIQNATTAEATF